MTNHPNRGRISLKPYLEHYGPPARAMPQWDRLALIQSETSQHVTSGVLIRNRLTGIFAKYTTGCVQSLPQNKAATAWANMAVSQDKDSVDDSTKR